MPGEQTPLVPPSNASGSGSSKYYFLNSTEGDPRSLDGGEEIETIPEGTTEEEFAPRVLSANARNPSLMARKKAATPTASDHTGSNSGGGFFSFFTGGSKNQLPKNARYGDTGTLVKLRKAPIKIEPKVFFANERTFLAWMHLSVILAGASIAILAFADDSTGAFGQLYGVVLLPVAIAFILYSMYQYNRRATMIRHRHPGPYEDTMGPTVLGIMLMISIVSQFALKMYAMAYH